MNEKYIRRKTSKSRISIRPYEDQAEFFRQHPEYVMSKMIRDYLDEFIKSVESH